MSRALFVCVTVLVWFRFVFTVEVSLLDSETDLQDCFISSYSDTTFLLVSKDSGLSDYYLAYSDMVISKNLLHKCSNPPNELNQYWFLPKESWYYANETTENPEKLVGSSYGFCGIGIICKKQIGFLGECNIKLNLRNNPVMVEMFNKDTYVLGFSIYNGKYEKGLIHPKENIIKYIDLKNEGIIINCGDTIHTERYPDSLNERCELKYNYKLSKYICKDFFIFRIILSICFYWFVKSLLLRTISYTIYFYEFLNILLYPMLALIYWTYNFMPKCKECGGVSFYLFHDHIDFCATEEYGSTKKVNHRKTCSLGKPFLEILKNIRIIIRGSLSIRFDLFLSSILLLQLFLLSIPSTMAITVYNDENKVLPSNITIMFNDEDKHSVINFLGRNRMRESLHKDYFSYAMNGEKQEIDFSNWEIGLRRYGIIIKNKMFQDLIREDPKTFCSGYNCNLFYKSNFKQIIIHRETDLIAYGFNMQDSILLEYVLICHIKNVQNFIGYLQHFKCINIDPIEDKSMHVIFESAFKELVLRNKINLPAIEQNILKKSKGKDLSVTKDSDKSLEYLQNLFQFPHMDIEDFYSLYPNASYPVSGSLDDTYIEYSSESGTSKRVVIYLDIKKGNYVEFKLKDTDIKISFYIPNTGYRLGFEDLYLTCDIDRILVKKKEMCTESCSSCLSSMNITTKTNKFCIESIQSWGCEMPGCMAINEGSLCGECVNVYKTNTCLRVAKIKKVDTFFVFCFKIIGHPICQRINQERFMNHMQDGKILSSMMVSGINIPEDIKINSKFAYNLTNAYFGEILDKFSTDVKFGNPQIDFDGNLLIPFNNEVNYNCHPWYEKEVKIDRCSENSYSLIQNLRQMMVKISEDVTYIDVLESEGLLTITADIPNDLFAEIADCKLRVEDIKCNGTLNTEVGHLCNISLTSSSICSLHLSSNEGIILDDNMIIKDGKSIVNFRWFFTEKCVNCTLTIIAGNDRLSKNAKVYYYSNKNVEIFDRKYKMVTKDETISLKLQESISWALDKLNLKHLSSLSGISDFFDFPILRFVKHIIEVILLLLLIYIIFWVCRILYTFRSLFFVCLKSCKGIKRSAIKLNKNRVQGKAKKLSTLVKNLHNEDETSEEEHQEKTKKYKALDKSTDIEQSIGLMLRKSAIKKSRNLTYTEYKEAQV